MINPKTNAKEPKESVESKERKEPEAKRRDPVEVIREGAIAASIWKRQTPTGFEYLDFSLSRSWRLKTGVKEGYSQNFFETNEAALQQVIARACAYIRLHQPATSSRERAGHREPAGSAA